MSAGDSAWSIQQGFRGLALMMALLLLSFIWSVSTVLAEDAEEDSGG